MYFLSGCDPVATAEDFRLVGVEATDVAAATATFAAGISGRSLNLCPLCMEEGEQSDTLADSFAILCGDSMSRSVIRARKQVVADSILVAVGVQMRAHRAIVEYRPALKNGRSALLVKSVGMASVSVSLR